MGFECFFALSGNEALEIIKNRKIHVVLSDLNMPVMNGIELLKTVKKTHPDIIRLVLSGNSESQTVLNAINDGNILRYISKPWDDIELINIIKQAFELYNLKQEKKDLLNQLQEYTAELEARVAKKTKELFEIQNAAEIGKYTSQIVHNLNNPLSGMLGALQLIELLANQALPNMDEIKKYIHIARKSSDDMDQIISSILIHMRDSENQDEESIDMNALIKSEFKLYDINFLFKNKIQKEIDLDDSLPCFMGKRIQLKQIFDNIIKNAIDAMEDTDDKRFFVKTRFREDKIFIWLSDTGCGIAKEKLEHIFLPNFTTKPIGKGTGLGLASVKAMVEGYHGTITVESEPDSGTTFTISFPFN